MSQTQKEIKVAQVNELLDKLNQSVTEQNQVKVEIQKAYNAINKLEKVNSQYAELHEAVSEMNYQFQQIALRKDYHFNSVQDDLIFKLKTTTKESQLHSGIGTINPISW